MSRAAEINVIGGVAYENSTVTIFNEQRSPREFNDLFTLQSRTINTLGA